MYRCSSAYRDFQDSLAVSKELLRLERKLEQPPTSTQVKQSNGLKGGVAVLIVASFEGFLQSVFSERLQVIADQMERIDGRDLPESVWVHQVFESLNRAMKGHPLSPLNGPRSDRIPAIVTASRHVVSGIIDPTIFCDTMGNPNPKNVRALFRNIGINDVIVKVKPVFDRKWKTPTSSTFIEDKLLEIINRRNAVAHRAETRAIARADLGESIKFLSTLAVVLDRELCTHLEAILKQVPERTRPIV